MMMNTAKRILVVEDEADLRDLVAFNLEREGYTCAKADDGDSAITQLENATPDLVILDRMMPGRSGDEVIAHMKRESRYAAIPVIMLTAKADESDELVGFAMGAEDYVTKPFSMKALMARVAAVLRRIDARQAQPDADVLASGPVRIDVDRFEVTVFDAPVALTTTEFRLLRSLIASKGRIRTRNQLIDEALGPNVAVVDRTIDVHIASLRKKLGDAAAWLLTVRGAGYTWRAPTDSG